MLVLDMVSGVVVNDIPQEFLSATSVAIDTETMGLCIHRDRLCLVQLCFESGECYLIKISDGEKYPNLVTLLCNGNIQKIFHFARFDIAVLKRFFTIEIKNVFCTKIASKLVRTYTNKHGLKDLCLELLGVELSKEEQTSYWGGDLSVNQINYASNDVLYLHRIKDILVKRLKVAKKLELASACFDTMLNIVNLDLEHYDFSSLFNH